MRRVYNDELVPCGELDFPPLARLTLHRGARAALRFPPQEDTRAPPCTSSSPSASLLPNHAISFHDQNLRIIHYIPCMCVYVYVYIYIYLHDIRRRHGYCWWSSNPKPRPREQATEFNAGLRVPALNKLDIVILKERRTNHGGLIFSRSRF